jgi:acyl-CoA thioesterase II
MSKKRPSHSDVLGTLDLENLEDNVFEGLSPATRWGRIFGGQVIGQALVAAQRTVETITERPTHSFHSHFLRPGDPDVPIRYDVETIRDGRSFSTRHVRATQNGKGILMMTASFQDREEGFEHQVEMPVVPGPDEVALTPEIFAARLAEMPDEVRKEMNEPRPIEMRFITDREMHNPKSGDPEVDLWFRIAPKQDMPGDLAIHEAALAFASDMSFMDTALIPHGSSLMDPKVHGVSLDHSVWFHEPVNMKDWLLFKRESPWASHGRGFIRGMIFNQQGKLVASVVQECLIRKLVQPER